MTTDLRGTLDGIAGRATAAAAPVPVDRLVRRLHARRTLRTLAASGLCAATVAGLALGAVALGRPPATPPADTSLATREPTADPTPTAVADPTAGEWPSSLRLTGEVTCGAPLPGVDDPDPEGSREVYLFTTVTRWPAVAGEPFGLQTSVAIGIDGVELHGHPTRPPQLVVLRDDVVVAMVDLADSVPDVLSATVPDGGGPLTEASVLLDRCDGGGVLPAGDYSMLVWQSFEQVTGADVGRPEVGALGGAEPLLLAGEVEGLRIEPADAARTLTCDDAFVLEPVDDPGTLLEGHATIGRTEGGGMVPDPAGDTLSVLTTVSPEGDLGPVNGNLVTRTYLVDADGRVAFWDDPALMAGQPWSWGWPPVDCRTGERLDGTFRVFAQATLWPWPGMDPTPVSEVVELPPVTVAPLVGGR